MRSFALHAEKQSRKRPRFAQNVALLAFFLGFIGMHKFYLGETGKGILYMVFFWTLIPGILAFVEFIMFLTMRDEEFNRKYGYA
jgi:TM2 domain-containing membrane protein YozV